MFLTINLENYEAFHGKIREDKDKKAENVIVLVDDLNEFYRMCIFACSFSIGFLKLRLFLQYT